jgi:glycosyltransferase involved in cell wall biosynthesis
MRVLLFDLYSSGHHLEFVSELRSALHERDPSITVDFLTLAPDEKHDMFFDPDEIFYLYEQSPLEPPDLVPDTEPYAKVARFVSSQIRNARWRVLRDFVDHVESKDYDIVHFPEADKIHEYLLCHLPGSSLPPAVGTLNGFFFKPGRTIVPPARPLRSLLERGLTPPFVRYVPQALRAGPAWNGWFLKRCLDVGALDHVFVHSSEARDNLVSTVGSDAGDRISTTADPLEPWDTDPGAQPQARRRIDLPEEETILLFFGQMREEKGIHVLLDALEDYEGDPFTMVLAGSPSATSEREIAEVRRESGVDIVPRLGYIPQSEMREYFLAADGILFPYLRSFGALRTSNVFQKACAANRPIVASDFGVIGRRVREWDLGLLCDPGSSEDLCRALRTFVSGEANTYDPDRMAAYAESQTYDRLATDVHAVYSDLVDTDAP